MLRGTYFLDFVGRILTGKKDFSFKENSIETNQKICFGFGFFFQQVTDVGENLYAVVIVTISSIEF